MTKILRHSEGLNAVRNGKASESSSLERKIQKSIKTIFEVLKKSVTFPLRFLGSKTWSFPGVLLSLPTKIFKGKPIFENNGYHFTPHKSLSQDELRDYLKYAAVNAASFDCNSKWIEGLEKLEFHQFTPDNIDISQLPEGVQIKDNYLIDLETGLNIVICENDKEMIISFGALDSASEKLKDENKVKHFQKQEANSIKGNLLGTSPISYKRASQLIELIQKSKISEGKEITLTGQSLGGSLAAYVAIDRQLKAICINSLPLGAGLQHDLGKDVLSQANQYVTHISAKDDFLSDNKILKIIDRIFSFIGIRTPGIFGERFTIPSAYNDRFGTHVYAIGSFMKHLGYGTRTTPKEVINAEEIISHMVERLDSFHPQPKIYELTKKVLIHVIKSSLKTQQGISLNSYFKLNQLNDEDSLTLFALLTHLRNLQESRLGVKNKHLDYAARVAEQVVLEKVFISPHKKTEFLNLLEKLNERGFFTGTQKNTFEKNLEQASNQSHVLHTLDSKSHFVAAKTLNDAKFGNKQDTRLAGDKQKSSVLHSALEYNRGTVGGLGVVTRSLLPKQREYGHDARIITPFFSFYQETLKDKEIKFLSFIEHEFKGKMVRSTIYKVQNGEVNGGKEVPHYLVMPALEHNSLFDVGEVKDLYANYPHSGSSDRLLYFSSATAAFAGRYHGKKHKKSFDNLHIHGWHAGVSSLLMDKYYNPMRREAGLNPVKRIFQVHLSAEQGIHRKSAYHSVGINAKSRWINIHADALNTSDMILYVSRAAAQDAITKKHGFGVHYIATKKHKQHKLKGITNGITHNSYDPFNKNIYGHLAITNIEEAHASKVKAKHYAYEQNLIADPSKPLFMFVGRYSSEKGVDMLPEMIEEIAKLGGQTVIMGIETQDASLSKTMEKLKNMAENPALNFRFYRNIQDQLKKVGDSGIQAGNLIRLATEVSLVPSHEEACGLVPMELLSVGSLILTSQVQGLKDTCKGWGQLDQNKQKYELKTFNSFVYDNAPKSRRKNSLIAVQRAFDYFSKVPKEEQNLVIQRLITESHQYDWLQNGGAIEQIEESYKQA